MNTQKVNLKSQTSTPPMTSYWRMMAIFCFLLVSTFTAHAQSYRIIPNQKHYQLAPFVFKKSEQQKVQAKVTSAKLTASKPIGNCPQRVTFGGTITTNGKTTVRYQFMNGDGSKDPSIRTLHFSKAGTKRVTTHQSFNKSQRGWKAIVVISPNKITSNPAQFKVTCNNSNSVCGKRTNFNPKKHGFNFENRFTNYITRDPDITTSGRCGGMVYAALDYYNYSITPPRQSSLPQDNTALGKYIYDRQIHSMFDNSDKWAELFVNPFGWRTTEFFNWGLQGYGGGRLQELRQSIDRGQPVPLGLFLTGNGGAGPHHQVLAIGYDCGRYKGDLKAYKEDLKIFVYDPNYPNKIMTLVPNVAGNYYYYKEHKNWSDKSKWQTYFVDKKYARKYPPR